MEQKISGLSYRALILSTLAFTVCFAAWMINGVLITFLVNNEVFKWSSVEIGWLLGVPVLVGSVFRLPVGMLTDKFGGKWVMSAILFFSAIPMFFLSAANSFSMFLLLSFWIRIVRKCFCSRSGLYIIMVPERKTGNSSRDFRRREYRSSNNNHAGPEYFKSTHS